MSLLYSFVNGTHIIENSLTKVVLLLKGSSIEVCEKVPKSLEQNSEASLPKVISCLIGLVRLKINSYIVLCDKHQVVGSINGHKIARATRFNIVPLGDSTFSKKDAEEVHYVELLYQHLNQATLYYSLDGSYDLTNSLQRQMTSKVDVDKRFWWNHYMCTDLVANGASEFITPLIYGYFKSQAAVFLGKQSLEFALLTRRSIDRAGTRYFRRGIDNDGKVANYNETEQFLTINNSVYSFLQIRGSVPVFWGEINNLKYKPNLVVGSRSSLDATASHFREQITHYNEIICVNLVNQKGYELPVKRAFETAMENLPSDIQSKVKYIYFDFHHECRNMRWDRVKVLLDILIKEGYTSSEYFHYDFSKREIISTQKKIVRTNCMDCLDRTNVVQSTLGRWVLQNQFVHNGVIADTNPSPWELLDPRLNYTFQNFWADNADAVSCAYSGTGALKTDFTRTGQRTRKGALSDLMNSITRYYKNNLTDGARQDGFDLFLGLYKPFQSSITSPFIDKRPPYIQLLPYLLCTSMLVMFAIMLYPRGSITDWKNIIAIGGCIIFNVRSVLYLNSNGYQFVNWPKLVPLDYVKKVDLYDGQGKLIGIKYEEADHSNTSIKKTT